MAERGRGIRLDTHPVRTHRNAGAVIGRMALATSVGGLLGLIGAWLFAPAFVFVGILAGAMGGAAIQTAAYLFGTGAGDTD